MYAHTGAHKCCEVAPRSVQHHMIAWNSDVLTTVARLCPYLDHCYVTATTVSTEATQVYNYYCSKYPIWSMTERSKFLFRTSLFSVVRRFLAPLCGAYGLVVHITPHKSGQGWATLSSFEIRTYVSTYEEGLIIIFIMLGVFIKP